MQHSVKGYFFGMFLLLMVALLTQESVEAIESYKDVYPERIHTTRHKRDLSTSVKGYHEDKVTYKIGDIVLDLKRSEKIHPGHILVRSYDEDTEQLTHEKVTPEQCHYHGKIRGNKDSDVHISTCDGLHGIIHGGRVKREIEKVNDDGLHRLTSLYDEMITDATDILKELDNDEIYLGAGIDNESNTQRDTKQIRQSHFHNNKKYHPRFSLFNVEEQYKKYLGENSKTRYIEMFVCTDVGLYEKYDKDKNKVIERVLNAYSQVDKAYQAINIRIVIVAVEVLVKKAFERFEKAGSDLYSFQIYWNEVIKKDSNFKDIRMDNGQFLSHYHWAYAGGMAYDGGMCTDDSVAVNRWYYYLVNGPKVILGHELGHNLNFDDDGPECTCLTSKGCFMGGTKSSMPGFSDCSLKRMQLKDFTCLNDYPEKSLKPVCGNGIKEANEECDCGTEETCKNNNDHCCQPFGCKLKQGVQCSHLNFPGCCNEKCLFRGQGTLCREATHICDLSEYCTGKSEKCPADQVKINGHNCDRHPSMLIGPKKRYGEFISNINKLVSAQYLKFVPKKWKKDGYPGFKLSIHGCSGGDCEIDLLAKLDNNAFEASSFRASYEPENVRYDGKGWSANQKTGNNWLKIDLGSIKKINTIGMKDIYWNWVYGYHLYYSNDNVNFLPYISKTDMEKGTLTCYNGQCIPNLDDQCKALWDIESQHAPEQCWRKFNVESSLYGTCKATAEEKCEDEEMYCGQIQCSSNLKKPYFIDYANPKNTDRYKKVTVDGKKCSGASIVGNEEAGIGMVNDGTKCGENKICVQQKCVSIESLPNVKKCLQTCKGTCRNDGSCYCQENLNPKDGCKTSLTAIHGMWSSWSEYSPCSLACGKGTQTRFRFCNQPYPQFGGNDCEGDREETHNCNIEDCPIEHSCWALRNKFKKLGKPLYDGIYIIEPKKDFKLKVNCDMTRHGGGWTLIVSSESNTWTEENVYERNKDKPYLKSDYSILKYANLLKEKYLIKADKFQYMLEANFKDRWGGIWEAPNQYDISSTNKYLSNVKLIKKFDDWKVGKYTIDNRLPYVNKHVLTTSRYDNDSKQYGSITDNKAGVHPSYWIYGNLKLTTPENVWYWVREGEYEIPASCFEILKRGKTLGKDFPNGFYTISPDNKTPMKTFCDFTRHGGGWTLLIQKSSNNGWTNDNAGSRGNSISESSLPNDFSIFKYIDYLKGTDPAEVTFQYMIEADGDDQNGGIFTYSVSSSLLTSPPRNIKPTLLKRFGNWGEKENFENFPMFRTSANGVFVQAGLAGSEDKLGSIISDGSDQNVGYMNSLKNPKNIKVWIRESGSRKSCNDIAIRGYHKGKVDYKNGLYLINNNQLVYCDMEKTSKEGWTLLVTSVSSGWTKDMVLSRNEGNPSISKDYSILSKGDSIKSLSTSETFKYMLDAGQRHRWGGIFQASTKLSLIGNKKEETIQLEQFDTWGTHWSKRLSKILPYLATENKGRALLTTTTKYAYYYESGTICASDSNGFHPAMWVDTNRSPGSIWYWLNENDCGSDYKKVDGGYSEWSTWTRCEPCVQNQKKTRKRFCNNPKPSCGGEECKFPLEEEADCDVDCIVEHSCLALRNKLKKLGKPLYDGIYIIEPKKDLKLRVNCDMTRHGGGWTLIVSSESNTWTEENVYERNKDKPYLKSDYSILKYANDLKENYLIKADKFQYILEANFKDRWGGIWEAPNQYDISSTNKYLSNVKLIKKFDDWKVGKYTIDNRLPYVNKHVLTTSRYDNDSKQYGSITDNKAGVHPSYWIYGNLKLTTPENVWYWVREGEYETPASCLEILKRGKTLGKDFPNGFYMISPDNKTPVKTFCDFTRHGGGWTLLIQKSSNNGWTKENAGSRGNSISEQSLPNDFSIFKFIDYMKGTDPAEVTFQYMIEADGDDQNGGIFTYSVSSSLLTSPPRNIKPKLLKRFGNWDEKENFENFPMFRSSVNGVFVKAGLTGSEDKLGSIISDGSDQNVGYMNSLKNPKNIKLWIREGGSRKSCNDIAIRGYHKGKVDYKNGLYLINNNQLVYCDMEKTSKEGWTLLVTSVSSGWTKDMVLSRNEGNPSISKDYSILSKGDSIKSLSTSETFKYMLDAGQRHRWGGIFQASTKLSLIGNKKEETIQLEQFDTWGTHWSKRLSKILPYLGRESKGRALLTTTVDSEDYHESGTICAIDSNGFHPAMWVNTNRSPGSIWYWLNENDCGSDYKKVDGGYSEWSTWTRCEPCVQNQKKTRKRFCNNPKPRCGGEECKFPLEEEADCDVDCIVEHSCLALRNKLKKLGKPLYDGIYIIEPKKDLKLRVNCDMTRHGGGWTLIVSSESNTWTEENVYERNKDKPYLKSDYSILKYANDLKENYLIKADKFQYILEANFKNRWGGIWEAPNQYDISSTNKYLSNVKLIKKFDDWKVGKYTIDNRLPYVNKHVLTTSRYDNDSKQYGSITDNKAGVHPSYWIYGNLKLTTPENVWYWVREGDYETPASCLEILKRGKTLGKDFPNGFYMISPDNNTPVKTFCDFTRHGGGWTLLIQKSSNNGWTKENAGSRGNSISEQSLPNDFSIFKFIDYLKGTDPAEVTFQYMIEADGDDQNGGIFTYSVSPSLLTYPPRNIKPKLLKRFGNWDEKENFENFPMFRSSANGVFVKSGLADSEEKLGSIISDGSDENVGYMNSLKNPKNIKVWIREGGSRKSCNDIAIRGYHKGKVDYKNGLYLINNNQLVYCDMEKTSKEGWTLLVTSVSSGWTKDMVLSRNEGNPSISKDYSILSKGDSIKSLSTSETFKYMLDAGQRHRWGGIFQASTKLSLIGNKKEETTQLEQFDTWGTDWWKRLSKILPYLATENKGRALLTTTTNYAYYYESGTICASDSNGFHPAMWVDTNRSPGSIWYWLNENDCGSDYKKVHGGYSEWSTWTRCQPCVQNQKKTRKRFCDEPKPSCGGEECKFPLEEEAACNVDCKGTLITSKDEEYCLEPETGGCSADDTKIVYRPRATQCNTDASKFAYDPDKGVITHICSKKRVCVIGKLKSGSQVVLSSSCPEQTNANAAWRTVFETIQYGEKCFTPDSGKIENGRGIVLSSSYCMAEEEKISFESLDLQSMPVEMKFYKLKLSENSIEAFMKNEGFANGERVSGYIDNMITPYTIDSWYQVKLSTFFKAPMSGNYHFVVAVDDVAQVYIGEVPGKEGLKKKKKIVDVTEYTSGRFNFAKYSSQKSDAIELRVGKKYYLEALMVEGGSYDYLTIGVYFPDGTSVIPITSYYLSRNAD